MRKWGKGGEGKTRRKGEEPEGQIRRKRGRQRKEEEGSTCIGERRGGREGRRNAFNNKLAIIW